MDQPHEILLNALKSYAIDQQDYTLTDAELETTAQIVYDRLLLRIELLGYFEIKSRTLVHKEIMGFLHSTLHVPMTFLELSALADELTEAIREGIE
jgi:hypothetical protein